MTSAGWATLDVIPSVKGLRSELEKQTGRDFTAAGVAGGSRFGSAAGKSAGARFGSVFKTAAKAGILGGLAVAAGAIKLGSDAIGEAREAQKVGRLTAAVIKSTGGAAKVSEKQVGNLSGRLSEMAGLDDEMIQSGANTILTFTKIRNAAGKGNKIFDRATLAALNMSSALGTDLQGASIQVGKALNDPIKGVTALGRAGVQFTEDQKTQIKAMVESGDTLGAQKIILGELSTQFEGAAKSQATSSDKLSVAFGNIKEELGTALLPLLDRFTRFLLRDGVPAAKEFTRWFKKEGVPGIKGFVDEVKPLANELLPAAADAFDAIRTGAKKALPIAEDLVDAFNDMPDWAKKALVGGTVAGFTAKKLPSGLASNALGSTAKALGLAKPVNVFVTNPGFGAGAGGGTVGVTGAGKFGKIAGAAMAASIVVAAIPLVDSIAKAGGLDDWLKGSPFDATDLGNKLGLPDWFAGDDPQKDEADSRRRTEHLNDFWTAGERASESQRKLGAATDVTKGKFAAFFPEVNKSKNGVKELKRQGDLLTATPIKPYIDTTSIERAIALLDAMDARLRRSAQVERGTDGGVTFQHGTGGTSPNTRAGVNFNGPINVTAHDYNDFTSQLEKRSRLAQRGGRG